MSLKNLRNWLSLVILSTSVFAGALHAEQAPIQQDMAVEGRGSSERVKASIRGFFEVLVALPGEQLDSQTRRDLAGEADSYLQGYRYVTRNEQLYLQLYFDREAIEQRVQQELAVANRSTDLPVMAGQPVLLWLAITQGDLEALLTKGSQGLLPNTLNDISFANGQPVILPADEALERGEVQVAQLRRGEVEPVMRASALYGMDRVLMGSVTLVDGDQWSGTWQIPGGGRQWRSTDGSLESVLEQGLKGYQQLTRNVSASTGRGFGINDQQVAISIGGLQGMDDFLWLKENLSRALGSAKVRPVVVGSQTALFAVDAGGSVDSVRRQLESLQRLSSVPTQFNSAGSAQSADISYMLY